MIPFPVHSAPSLGSTAEGCGDLGGLLALVAGSECAMPLVSVRVRTRITEVVARTVVEQRFRNTFTAPMEAVHLFPVPSGGAVLSCELRCGELTVRAACVERGAAEAKFAAARSQGKRAALLTQERADIHTLRVTNLPPGQEVVVRFEIVERLGAEDGRVRWRFPTVIAPRYLSGRPVDTGTGPGVLPDTDRVPDASRISPPLLLTGGARLDLEVALDGVPARLESSLHALAVEFEGGVRIAPAGDARCDRDFVLALTWADTRAVRTRACTDGGYTLVHIEAPLEAPRVLPRDAIFVVDISGSMAGSKMDAAKRALTAALHGLTSGDRFQLIAFDDRIELHAPDFVAYDAGSLAKADRWVAALRPRGGTEMLPAIGEALKGTTPAGRLRTVLFVTDGQAHNEQELVAAVANRRAGVSAGGGEARFFTLGIDTAVNEALLSRLARVGGGTATFATPSDDIEAVVARMEARFGSPVALDVRVTGGEVARPEPEALFAGLGVGVLLKGAPAQVALSMRTAAGNETVLLDTTPLHGMGGTFRALWARERVAMLEDRLVLKPFEEEALRPEIIRTALFQGEETQEGSGIASRYTAFVAVEETTTVGGERVTVVQGHPLPAQWEEQADMGLVAQMAPGAGAPQMLASPTPRGFGGPYPSRAAPRPAAPAAKTSGVLGRVRSMFTTPAAPPERDDAAIFDVDAVSAASTTFGSTPAPAAPAARPAASADALKKGAAPAPDAELAATQGADGSFGGDVARTAAALFTLILLGNTRTQGLRKRNVQKAASWLLGRTEPEALLALAALHAAERGEAPATPSAALLGAGREGRLLADLTHPRA